MSVGLQKVEEAKHDGSWSKLDATDDGELPQDLLATLATNQCAYDYFMAFRPSEQKRIVRWIETQSAPKRGQNASKKWSHSQPTILGSIRTVHNASAVNVTGYNVRDKPGFGNAPILPIVDEDGGPARSKQALFFPRLNNRWEDKILIR